MFERNVMNQLSDTLKVIDGSLRETDDISSVGNRSEFTAIRTVSGSDTTN